MKLLLTLNSPSIPEPGFEVIITEKDLSQDGVTMLYGDFMITLVKIKPKYGENKNRKDKSET